MCLLPAFISSGPSMLQNDSESMKCISFLTNFIFKTVLTVLLVTNTEVQDRATTDNDIEQEDGTPQVEVVTPTTAERQDTSSDSDSAWDILDVADCRCETHN